MKKMLLWSIVSSLAAVSAHAQAVAADSDVLKAGGQTLTLPEGNGTVESGSINGVVNIGDDGQVLIYDPGSTTYISDIVYAASGDLYLISDGEVSLTALPITDHPIVGSFEEDGTDQDLSPYFTDPDGKPLQATVFSDVEAVPEPTSFAGFTVLAGFLGLCLSRRKQS